MEPERLTVDGTTLHMLASVKGLVTEGDTVREAFAAAEPAAVALGVSPGEVEGLREWDGEPYDLSGWDELYGLALALLVDDDGVRLPPPAFRVAVEAADAAGVPVEGLDLDEEAFTTTYTEQVSTWQWFRYDRLQKRLRKRGFVAETPEELALEVDNRVCTFKGYAAVERAREAEMARRLREVCAAHDPVLAIIELPRVPGVLERLQQSPEAADDAL